MANFSPHNLPFYWSTLGLRMLHKSGVRHIVISPGSRSTPLTMAAAAHNGFTKHVILDERAAAFFALGIGKSTGYPAALICTSGTAVANYFPAIIEARQSHVPLLALTADRPKRLKGTGANQTINQQQIFGSYPLLFDDVGSPSEEPDQIKKLHHILTSAFEHAYIKKGPVHLNFPFDKPLEPAVNFVQQIREENNTLIAQSDSPQEQPQNNSETDESLTEQLNQAKKPLIIIGQLPAGVSSEAFFELAEAINAPVISEQKINRPAHTIQQFDGFLNHKHHLESLKPDLILRCGLQPASRALLRALKQWRPGSHIYFSVADMWADVASSVTARKEWNGSRFAVNLLDNKPDTWLKKWKKAASNFTEKASTHIAREPALTDGHIYHLLSAKIPARWFIFFSNSFTARDRCMFGTWGTQNVFTNRGASGIDGITSTAMGTSVARDTPGILFTGDLAFLHDTNALLNHRELTSPLVVVVVNNSGGGIFKMLPIAEHEEYFNTYFKTPQQVNISTLCKAYDIDYTQINSKQALKKLPIEALTQQSNSKLQVVECITNFDASMELRNKLWGLG